MPSELVARWRSRADELRPFSEGAAVAFTQAADELEEALRIVADEELSLAQAAEESGYSLDRLRHMISEKQIPNAGRKGAPRIRRRDLPIRPGKANAGGGYNPDADARSLVALRRG